MLGTVEDQVGLAELWLSQMLRKKFDQSKVGATNGIKDRVSNCG